MKPRPHGRGIIFIRPFVPEGQTAGGVYIAAHHRGIKPIYGRVTDVHETCTVTRPGDWVVFLPERPTRVPHTGGVIYYIAEGECLSVIEAGDGRPWFAEDKQATERKVLA
jgi:hypothetical protein